jgi:hypothetical protein
VRFAGAIIATLVLAGCASHPDRQWIFRDDTNPPDRQWIFRDDTNPPHRVVFDSSKVRAWILDEENRIRDLGSSDWNKRHFGDDPFPKFAEVMKDEPGVTVDPGIYCSPRRSTGRNSTRQKGSQGFA